MRERLGRALDVVARRTEAAYPLLVSATTTLMADDLWPLVRKLSQEEQVRLAKLALTAAARGPDGDRAAYLAAPPNIDEFSSEDDALSWEAEGWENVDASR